MRCDGMISAYLVTRGGRSLRQTDFTQQPGDGMKRKNTRFPTLYLALALSTLTGCGTPDTAKTSGKPALRLAVAGADPGTCSASQTPGVSADGGIHWGNSTQNHCTSGYVPQWGN